ncbi:hypothetical protein CBLAS_0593 [Campylobacter blaseri]|uniref:hypothetical protein n=1 Tax=Campylobacter blaseri TaxID=2042961 RepID=UPI00155DB4F1|nr:hypothetical protein [Campylobacter blaseri]QKF85786.1 hypothetical protein CBLAS_0593 [Campylobacter blaseri]
MATYKLDLNGDYSSEVLSYYLWGQKNAPSKSEIADTKWIDRKEGITLNVDGEELAKKLGNFVNAKDFKLFEVF